MWKHQCGYVNVVEVLSINIFFSVMTRGTNRQKVGIKTQYFEIGGLPPFPRTVKKLIFYKYIKT